jgi:hypothetical protein
MLLLMKANTSAVQPHSRASWSRRVLGEFAQRNGEHPLGFAGVGRREGAASDPLGQGAATLSAARFSTCCAID